MLFTSILICSDVRVKVYPVHGELLFCQNTTARCSLVIVPMAGRFPADEGAIHIGRSSIGNAGQAHAARWCPLCRCRIPVAQASVTDSEALPQDSTETQALG